MPVLVRMPSPEPALACIPSVLLAASGALHPLRVEASPLNASLSIQRITSVCVDYTKKFVYATRAGGIDENRLRAFTLSIAKGTPLLLGRGAARGADARRLQGRPDLVLEILLAALPSLGRLPVPEVHRVEAVVAVPP